MQFVKVPLSEGLDSPTPLSSNAIKTKLHFILAEPLEKRYERPPSPEWFEPPSREMYNSYAGSVAISDGEDELSDVEWPVRPNPLTSNVSTAEAKHAYPKKPYEREPQKPYPTLRPNLTGTFPQEEEQYRAKYNQAINALALKISNEPPFVCPYLICDREGKPFSKKPDVKRHINTCHLFLRGKYPDHSFSRIMVALNLYSQLQWHYVIIIMKHLFLKITAYIAHFYYTFTLLVHDAFYLIFQYV
jgi:hypothetical protein